VIRGLTGYVRPPTLVTAILSHQPRLSIIFGAVVFRGAKRRASMRALRTFVRRHLRKSMGELHDRGADCALASLGPRCGQVNLTETGRLTSAAAALAMKSIDRFARQSLTAGPFSRELRAPPRKGVFQPLFWRLPIAHATSAQALFSWSWGRSPMFPRQGLRAIVAQCS
jgi:hypothetical protein